MSTLTGVLELFQLTTTQQAEQPLKQHQVGAILLAAFEALIRTTVQHCDTKGFDLTAVPAYDGGVGKGKEVGPSEVLQSSGGEWAQSMLQIYKQVYFMDCERAKKEHKHKESKLMVRGLAVGQAANSRAVRSLLEFLASRKPDSSLKQDLDDVTEEVHDSVFGLQQPQIPVSDQIDQIEIPKFKIKSPRKMRHGESSVSFKKKNSKAQLDGDQTPRLPLVSMLNKKQHRNASRIKLQSLQLKESILYEYGHIYHPDEFPTLVQKKRHIRKRRVSPPTLLEVDFLNQSIDNKLHTTKGRDAKKSSNLDSQFMTPIVMSSEGENRSSIPIRSETYVNFKVLHRKTMDKSKLDESQTNMTVRSSVQSSVQSPTVKLPSLRSGQSNLRQSQTFSTNTSLFRKPTVQPDLKQQVIVLDPTPKDIGNELPEVQLTPRTHRNHPIVRPAILKKPSNSRVYQEDSVVQAVPLKLFAENQTSQVILEQRIEETQRSDGLEEDCPRSGSPSSPLTKEGLAQLSSRVEEVASPIRRYNTLTEIPSHLWKFDRYQDSFKFNALGIYNTKREMAFYKVVAKVGGRTFDFQDVAWDKSTQTVWRFAKNNDKILDASQIDLQAHSSIIYQIQRYDVMTKKIDESFAFAVQPLLTQVRKEGYLVQGQYQLPLYIGQCPPLIQSGTKNPTTLLKQALIDGSVKTMDFVQLIARLSTPDSTEAYAKSWYPSVQPSMLHVSLPNKAKIVNYVLHAKHGKLEEKKDKLDQLIGEDFPDHKNAAKHFIN